MTIHDELNAPWSIHFERDGTEDVAVIYDAGGHELVTSRHFWLPQGDDPVPSTLVAMRAIKALPAILDALETAAFEMQYAKWGTGDAISARQNALSKAREALAGAKGGRS